MKDGMPAHDTSNAAAAAEGLGELALNDTSPPSTNLPLPRELRDQIYHYLLSGEYARTGTAYHFHTNILAVNRTIHGEAEQYLYKRNIFVVVSYTWGKSDPSLLSSVPIVTTDNHKVGRMKHHSMRFHASLLPSKYCLQQQSVTGRARFTDPQIRSLLTLVGDLEELCCSFQLRLFGHRGRVVYIASSPGCKLELCVPQEQSVIRTPSCIFELRDTPHRPMSLDLQRSLLLPFHGFVADDQKVSFRGVIADAAGAETTKSVMNASLICCEAKTWALYDVCFRHKDHCDALVLNKSYEAASLAYDYIIQRVEFFLRSDVLPATAQNTATSADWAVYVLLLEMWLSVAWLALRNKDLARMEVALDQRVMRTCSSSAVMDHMLSMQCRSALSHICILARLYIPTRAPPGGVTMGQLGQILVKLRSSCPTDVWVEYDAAVIVRTLQRGAFSRGAKAEGVSLDEDATLSPYEKEVFQNAVDAALRLPAIHALPIDMCSAQNFQPRIYSSANGGNIPKRPDSIIGWQDKAQLAALSIEDKAAINRVQKAHGFEVTSFS